MPGLVPVILAAARLIGFSLLLHATVVTTHVRLAALCIFHLFAAPEVSPVYISSMYHVHEACEDSGVCRDACVGEECVYVTLYWQVNDKTQNTEP